MIGLHRGITLVHNTRYNQRQPMRQCNRIPKRLHSFLIIIIHNGMYRGLLYECMFIYLNMEYNKNVATATPQEFSI